MLYISLLFALIAFGVSAHLNQLHHTAIFVRQDVAMLHVEAGKINEAAAHLEVARVQGLILVFRIWNDAVSVFFTAGIAKASHQTRSLSNFRSCCPAGRFGS